MDSHDEWCEKIIVDVGPGNIESPCGCKERWSEAEIEHLKVEVAILQRQLAEAYEILASHGVTKVSVA